MFLRDIFALLRTTDDLLSPVFWIRDILVRIWIRILGSIPFTNGSGTSFFVSDLQDANKNYNFSLIFYAYSFKKVHLDNSSKKKSHKEVT